jgi:hypothetical protein
LLILAFGCKKDTGFSPLPSHVDNEDSTKVDTPVLSLGEGRARLNGSNWLATYKSFYTLTDTTRFQLWADRLSSSLRSEHLRVLDVPLEEGVFDVEKTKMSDSELNLMPDILFGKSQDFDQPLADYSGDTTKHNYIEITRYDRANRTIEGRYQLYLYPHRMSQISWNPPPPNYIELTEGSFYLKLIEY